jgi:hypothetical protein
MVDDWQLRQLPRLTDFRGTGLGLEAAATAPWKILNP